MDRSFWIIVDGTVPTAFRAPKREDLLPTLHQLQRTQPTVTLVWFERGRTWASPEEARADQERRRKLARERKDTWRPGGAHVDPRAKYKITRDEKRARFKKRATFERQRSESDAPPPPRRDRPFGSKPPGAKPYGRKPFGSRPPGDRPFGSRPQGDRPFGSRPPGDRPRGDRPFGKRPPRSSDGSGGGSGRDEKRPWRPSKPGGWAPRGRPKSPWRPKGPRGPKGGGGR